MSWNRVSFSDIGSNWPSQNIHPAGAKLPANILISPTYGCAMFISLVRRGEYPLQRDGEADDPKRLHVQVRLAAADVGYSGRKQRHQIRSPRVTITGRAHQAAG